MTDEKIHDVAVIGGGPAGASFAGYARQKGLSVVVLEKERFPRDHVGESLIPFVYTKLKELGALEKVREFATYKPGVNFVDTDGGRQSTWCFNKLIKDESALSFHTLRATFDKCLLDHAAGLGADVREETAVRGVDLDDPSGCVTVETEHADGGKATVRARFLVDASGQNTFLSKRLGVKRSIKDLDRVALFCHWRNNRYDEALKEGLIKIVYLGGDKKGWLWVIPVGTDHLSIGVTLNNSYVRTMKAKLEAEGTDNWLEALYLHELGEATTLDGILAGAHLEHEVLTLGDYSYYAERKFGSNFAMVGDAGAFLDPIFSSGIYVAMETASRVAEAVRVKIQEGDEAGERKLEEEFVTINGAYVLIEKFIRLFYSPELFNFANTGGEDGVSYKKFLYAYNVFHYLLAGDFFGNYQKYIEFIDCIMDSVRAYDRFLNYVKADTNVSGNEYRSCGYSFDQIYGHLLGRQAEHA